MDVEKILEEVKADPAKLGKKLIAEGGDVLDGLKNNEAVKDVLEKGEELLKEDSAKDLLEKGGDLLKGLLGGKKE